MACARLATLIELRGTTCATYIKNKRVFWPANRSAGARRLAAIAEQNSNRPSLKLRPAGGIELNDRRRPQNFARPAAAALPNGWPFQENRKRTGQKDRLEQDSYRTHIFSILKERISYHDHPTIT